MNPPAAHTLPERFRPPLDSVIYAIGDIHGRADLLDRLHEAIVRDARRHTSKRRVIVYLGDYIDRGFDSAGVVARLLGEGPPGFERRFLMGNHDAFLLEFLEGDFALAEAWMWNGGVATLESYGLAPMADRYGADWPALLHADLARAVPSSHLAFFRALELNHREGGLLFVHAGLRPGVPVASQTRADMLWIREEFLEAESDFGALVIHGHTITPEVAIRPHRIGIDTGAWRSGTLTAAVFAGEVVAFLQT